MFKIFMNPVPGTEVSGPGIANPELLPITARKDDIIGAMEEFR